MKTVNYKGYQASIEFEDDALYIRVLHIDDLLVARCNAASEVQKAFHDLIDEYLQDCAELGREPTKPFKGSFNVRLTPDSHRRVAMAAAEAGCTLNAWIAEAAHEKLECKQMSARVDRVFDRQKEVAFLRELTAHRTPDILARVQSHEMYVSWYDQAAHASKVQPSGWRN